MKFFCILLFMFCCYQSYSQEYVIGLKHWGVKEGLSHRQVNCICQDKTGFIWIGTKYGLNRFDGYSFVIYTRENSSLPFNNISQMAIDDSGYLWLRSDGRIVVFNPLSGAVLTVKKRTGYEPTDNFEYLHATPRNEILTGYNNGNGNFAFDSKVGWRNTLNNRIFNAPTAHRSFCPDGNWWVLTDSELVKLSAMGEEILKLPIPYKLEMSTYVDVPNSFYLVGKNANDVYNKTKDDKLVLAGKAVPEWDSTSIDIIFNTDIDDIVWRQGRLYHLQKGLIKDFGEETTGNLKTLINGIYHDSKGNLWLGSDYGLYDLTTRQNKFKQYFYQNPSVFKNDNSFRSIIVNGSKIYASAEIKGLMSSPLQRPDSIFYIVHATSKHPINYHSLALTRKNELIGNSSNFMYYLSSPQSRNIQWIKSDNGCWTIYQYSPDSLLLGKRRGLAWFDLKSKKVLPFTGYNQYKELESATVLQIMPDLNGKVWICSNTGLYTFDLQKGVYDRFSSDNSGSNYLPTKEFQHYCQDKDGIYWIGSADGLIKWDRKKGIYRLFTRIDGLSNNNIYGVYEDKSNRLWLSSDYGIIQFDKGSYRVKTYLTDDGITHDEFNRLSHFEDSLGNIYFGSMNGVTSFNPEDFNVDTLNANSAPLAITDFQQFDGRSNKLVDKTDELSKTNEIVLQPDDRFFRMEFALLNYSDPQQTVYYWKMDGGDTGWNIQKDRSLRFGRLPYGNQVLRVKAQAADGSWSNNILTIKVIVLKPFYLKPWFLLACLLLLVLIVVVWNRWKTGTLNKENERLDKVVNEKTRALAEKTNDLEISLAEKNILMKEIHHRVKNNLQVIGSLLDLQLARTTDEEAQKAMTEGKTRVRAIALIHQQLYQNDQITSIEISSFINELFFQINSIYIKKSQRIELKNNIIETRLDIDTAVPLGLVLNELITNSFKYAFPTTDGFIRIALAQHSEGYTLFYTDSGPGLPEGFDAKNAKTLGMVIITSLSKQLGGKFAYSNSDGNNFILTFKDAAGRKMVD